MVFGIERKFVNTNGVWGAQWILWTWYSTAEQRDRALVGLANIGMTARAVDH